MRDILAALLVAFGVLAVCLAIAVWSAQPPGPNPRQAHHVYEPFTVEVSVRDR